MAYRRGDRVVTFAPPFLPFRVIFGLIALLVRAAGRLLFGLRIKGTVHLRGIERAILVSNHTLVLDPGFIGFAILPRRAYYTMLEETALIPVLGTFTRLLGGMPLVRGPGAVPRQERGVNSVNFALMAEEEQNAVIGQFQNFLNSLDFSLEIVVQSRRLNITSYLDKLKDLESRQANDLLRTQIIEYRNFINEIVAGGSIMNKTFYVIIPFVPVNIPGVAPAGGNAKNMKQSREKTAAIAQEQFTHGKSQLLQRIEFVGLGLRRCGLQCVPLNSLELAEFFWTLHHPEEAERGYYPEIPPELIQ